MKTLLFIYPVLLVMLLGCKKDADVPDLKAAEAQKIARQYDLFHGKYGIVSSVSNEPVDINMDGVTSTDLFNEIEILPFWKNYHFNVEVRISHSPLFSPSPVYLFSQAWPEQYIQLGTETWAGGPGLDYDPSLWVDLVTQGTSRQFEFSEDMKSLNILPNENENTYRWVKPESVSVDPARRLIVVNKRHLYTKEGVKEVLITSVYERFTKIT